MIRGPLVGKFMRSDYISKAREITKKLTLKEKVGQITQQVPGWECYRKVNGEIVLTERFKNWVKEYGGFGAIEGLIRSGYWVKKFYGTGIEAHERIKVANLVQQYIMDNARVPIPAMIQVEAPHGVYALGGTVFPHNICTGSCFNPDLYEEMMYSICKADTLSEISFSVRSTPAESLLYLFRRMSDVSLLTTTE